MNFIKNEYQNFDQATSAWLYNDKPLLQPPIDRRMFSATCRIIALAIVAFSLAAASLVLLSGTIVFVASIITLNPITIGVGGTVFLTTAAGGAVLVGVAVICRDLWKYFKNRNEKLDIPLTNDKTNSQGSQFVNECFEGARQGLKNFSQGKKFTEGVQEGREAKRREALQEGLWILKPFV